MPMSGVIQTVRKKFLKFVRLDTAVGRVLYLHDGLCDTHGISYKLSAEFVQCRNDLIAYFLGMDRCLFVCYEQGLTQLDSPHVSRAPVAPYTWSIDSSLAKSNQLHVYIHSNLDWVLYVPRSNAVDPETFLRIDYSAANKIDDALMLNNVDIFLTPMGWSGEYVLFERNEMGSAPAQTN